MTHPPRLVQRIAIVGGASYVQGDLDVFLAALAEKYPYATIVTGSALRSCEPYVADECRRLGMPVEVVEPNYVFGDDAMICQVTDILMDVDVIVTVGSEGGARAARAKEIWQRMDSWREPQNQRRYHNVAAPEKAKKKATPRRAKKKAEAFA